MGAGMSSKEHFQASKILLEFVTHYVDLTQHQLLVIKEEMDKTCETIMDQVHEISSAADGKKKEAETIIVENKLVHSGEALSDETAAEGKVQRSGGLFTKSMEAISSFDEQVQGIVMGVIGIISIDDVHRQRLDHVMTSVHMLNAMIVEAVPKIQKGLNTKEVLRIRNTLLTKTYRLYTMEEEKELFHRYFGRPRAKTSAAA